MDVDQNEQEMDDEAMNDSDTETDDENTEREKKPIICELCKEILPTTLKEYKEHIAAHDPGNKKPFECKTCQAKFVTSNLMRIHEKSHKKENDRCKSEYCNTWFSKSSLMFRHNHKYHVDERIFKCKTSKEPFLTHQQLMVHYEKYHNPAESNVCSSPYKHIPRRFKRCPNIVTHNCDKCNRKFPTQTNLKLHIRTFHPAPAVPTEEIPETSTKPCEEEEPSEAYQCEYCGKYFKEMNSYDVHKMFHPEQLEDGETLSKNAVTGKFHCSKCDLNIYQLALYEAHMEKFHKNDYTCDVCKKFFLDREELPVHRRTHFKVENHVCEICKKRFLGSVQLKKHIKSNHPGAGKAKKRSKPVYFRRETFIKIFTRNL